MKETDGWVKIKKYTDGGKPVCGECTLLGDDTLCQYSKGGVGVFPNYNCPIWHGESKSEWQPIDHNCTAQEELLDALKDAWRLMQGKNIEDYAYGCMREIEAIIAHYAPQEK